MGPWGRQQAYIIFYPCPQAPTLSSRATVKNMQAVTILKISYRRRKYKQQNNNFHQNLQKLWYSR